jgi:multidrug efflux pump subunit AcrA (membrane-fusion protein)
MLAKVITALVLAFLLFAIFYKPMYPVTPSFTFASTEKRSVSAPFEGVIEDVFVKPGDTVAQGAPLLKLRTRELILQWSDAKKKAAKARAEAAKFGLGSAPEKQAEAQAALREAEAAEAEAALLADRIERATVKAPIAGEVFTGGDLREKIGATVKLGDPIMDIGDPTKLRAELLVPERDIQEISVGMKGTLATNAMPGESHPFLIDTIVKEGKPKEGENLFLVYATLKSTDPAWRPGMQGEAHVDIERRRFIWIYTHRLTDFLQLKMWKWWW